MWLLNYRYSAQGGRDSLGLVVFAWLGDKLKNGQNLVMMSLE